jgi:amidophosphoribosyltransferase
MISPLVEALDKPQCNCGIVGVFNHPQASVMSYYALHALQHRGQEAAGIVASHYDEVKNRKKFSVHKDEGLVLDVFSDPHILTEKLRGDSAIAHNRYSTTGGNSIANIQPFNMIYRLGNLALAHNGNLTNTKALRTALQNEGAIFQTTTDSELFLHLIARSKKETQFEQIHEAVQLAKGAFSVVFLTDTALYAARDPHGFRPLCIGKKTNPDGSTAYVIASETCALDIISAEYIRDVRHNEIIMIDEETVRTGEIKSFTIMDNSPSAHHCIFEYIYFSRPDSKIFGHNVDKVRRKLGKNLALESPVDNGDFDRVTVIPVPDSGNTATLGYARVNEKDNNIPSRYEIGLIRSHYVGRTFIAPGQDQREFKVKTKFNVVRGVLENRKVVVIDDSIVRGTTSKSLVKLVREANPAEVHLRITSPPITHPCMYGMDFPSKGELIANHHSNTDDIAEELGVDSLRYLSVSAMMDAVPQEEGIGYCTACFTGVYPVQIDLGTHKFSIEE